MARSVPQFPQRRLGDRVRGREHGGRIRTLLRARHAREQGERAAALVWACRRCRVRCDVLGLTRIQRRRPKLGPLPPLPPRPPPLPPRLPLPAPRPPLSDPRPPLPPLWAAAAAGDALPPSRVLGGDSPVSWSHAHDGTCHGGSGSCPLYLFTSAIGSTIALASAGGCTRGVMHRKSLRSPNFCLSLSVHAWQL